MSSNITPRILTKSLGIGKEQLSSVCMLEIILDLTLRLDKISITLVLLPFSFRKLQVIQRFKSCKNALILFLIMFAEESQSKEKLHCISSAYESTPRPCELAIKSALLKYKLNRTGPKIEPRGTPDLRSTV